MRELTPTILSLDGTDQGLISFGETSDLAIERNFRVHGHPAQPGDNVLLQVTGLQSALDGPAGTLSVTIGGVRSEIQSIAAIPGSAGLHAIVTRVPATTTFNAAVPVELQVVLPSGAVLRSNNVNISVEPLLQ
jgi:uncharacterized protein (TIGR03437 family)